MNLNPGKSVARLRAGLVVILTALALVATIVGIAQPAYAGGPTTASVVKPEDLNRPLTQREIIAIATQVQKTLTPAERKEVKRILAEVKSAQAAGGRAEFALPAIAVYAVYLIVRFGIPWLIRYAANVFNAVFLNQAIKQQVCQELRNRGNGWGWSWYCAGTY